MAKGKYYNVRKMYAHRCAFHWNCVLNTEMSQTTDKT